MKILAYNSSARGAGQFVRSLKIAKIITEYFTSANFLILAGNSYLNKSIPKRTEVIRLPEVHKNINGDLISNLDNLENIFLIRKGIIESVIQNYKPNVFFVDSRPIGLNGELLTILADLKQNSNIKAILLLRDIVDSPDIVRENWTKSNFYFLIDSLFDKVIIIGDKSMFNTIEAYNLFKFEYKVSHIGYLGNFSTLCDNILNDTQKKKQILVTVGGGFDGEKIIQIVCNMIHRNHMNMNYIVVLGNNSQLNISSIRQKYQSILMCTEFYTHIENIEQLILESEIIISMCGYNTIFELIEMQKKIIVIPRDVSGQEQIIRTKIILNHYDGVWPINMKDLCEENLMNTINVALTSKSPQKKIEFNGKRNLINIFEKEILR